MEPQAIAPKEAPTAAPSEGAGEERSRRAFLSAITAFGGRGVSLMISLVSLPLTIGFLDKERFGVWITIGSFLAWLGLADLGLGNGLTNALAEARAKGDHEAARSAVTTSFAVVGAVTLAMAVVFTIAFPFVPWARVLAASSRVSKGELDLTVALCAGIFFVSFPLNLVDKIYAGCQEGFVANHWSTVSNVITAIALVAAVRIGRGGLPILVVVLSGLPLLVRLAGVGYLFGSRHPELRPRRRAYRRDLVGSLLGTGTQFLVVQLAALGMWQNDNIIVAQTFGVEAVGPYSVAFRLASTYVGLVGMYLGPLWPAYADAAARGEYTWIRDQVRRKTKLVVSVTVVAAVGMIAIGGWFIGVWTRSKTMTPERSLLIPMAVYMVLIVACTSFASALNGLGQIRGQMIYGLAAAILNVGLSIVLARVVGIAGVCWATCVAALIPTVFASLELDRTLRERIAGRAAPRPEIE
ncbi:O-antigen flippase Wzx [Minicystis rosea]|nr:O-antigen flippase Wzx [Minicystis rosea]